MSRTAATRRATDRRGELAGSAMSVAMAVLFAGVVILGSKVQAGGPPFVTLAIRFGGQSLLLLHDGIDQVKGHDDRDEPLFALSIGSAVHWPHRA